MLVPNSRPILLFFALFLLILLACEREIDLNLNQEDKIVFLSNFSPNAPFKAIISSTKSLRDSLNHFLFYPDNAIVKLYKNDTFIDNFQFDPTPPFPNNTPSYISNIIPQPEQTYSISVEMPGFPNIYSSNTVPPQIDSSHFKILSIDSKIDSFDYLLVNILATLTFPNPDARYYRLIGWFEEQITKSSTFPPTQNLFPIRLQDDIIQNQLYTQTSTIFQCETSEQDAIELHIQFYIPNPEQDLSVNYFLELDLINKDYFFFHKSLDGFDLSQNTNSLSFANQPQLIHNNIEDGVGNFSAFTCLIREIKL